MAESSYLTTCGKYSDNVRIDGKVVIVTGANTGLGKATAMDLARRGGKIYMACRSKERGMEALNEIRERIGSDNLHFLELDLGSLDSVRAFSKNFHEIESRLDILINNAGVLMPLGRTKDNFETNMGVNHLGHFLLTNLLLDLLKAAAPSRIVVVSSKLHSIGNIDREDFNSQKGFPGAWKSYGNSKLANLLFVRKLSQKLEGTGVTINGLCPGAVNTEATRNLNGFQRMILAPIMKLFYKTPEQGAQTSVVLAVEPQLQEVSGKYFISSKQSEPSSKANDDETAEWLWQKSREMTGLEVAAN